ncbi:MAG: HD domain-containing protein [Candidatus Nanosalina sp.]
MLEEDEVEELRSRLKQEFSGYYELAGGKNYRYHHLVSVHRHVRKFLQRMDVEADDRVVKVAALFHDIGRKEDIEDSYLDPIESHEGHDEKGAEIVSKFVEDFLSDEQLEKVRKVVRNHHSEAETVEGKLVQDADFLTNYGVSDPWRMIHYSSEKERTMEEAFKYFENELKQNFREKLEEFHFDLARSTAEKRLENHVEAVEQMERGYHAEDL